MRITFEQKTKILTQLAQPDEWKSRLNMAWLLSDKRRARRSPPSDSEAADRNKPLESTKLIQRMSFDLTDWKGVPVFAVVNGVKLAIARDLGIEPDLRTFNEIDIEASLAALHRAQRDADEYEYELPGNHWRGEPEKKGLNVVEKAWLDSTEFSGVLIGAPHRFFIEKTDQGFDVATSLDFREWIVAHGIVLSHTLSHGAGPIENGSITAQSQSLLRALANGQTVRDHRDEEWSLLVVSHTTQCSAKTQQTRERMAQNFGLEGYDFSVVTFDEGLTLVAIRSAVLERTLKAADASHRLMGAIRSGLPAGIKADDFVRQAIADGAKLSYVDKDSGGKRSFLNAMNEAEAYELAASWTKLNGIPKNYALDLPAPEAA